MYCVDGFLKRSRSVLGGSMGEFTAVASAKRAVRGDFSDGGLIESVDEVSSECDRARAATCTCLFRLSDIAVRYYQGTYRGTTTSG